ncbi:MAG: TusE/DsrC/DsvC family sulfur relay protein [Gemmatimonadota bacterium]
MRSETLARGQDGPGTEGWTAEATPTAPRPPLAAGAGGVSPAPTPPSDDLAALHAKIDHLAAAVNKLDRRREELEELIEDLLPAVNGAMLLARDRLDALDRSGAWHNGAGALQAVETALTVVDPAELDALALALPELLRTARLLATPQITELAPRLLEALDEAQHGPAPTVRSLMRSARAPRTRRGMQVALSLLRALGSGTPAAPTTVAMPAPAPRRPSPAPIAPPGASPPVACGTPSAAPGVLTVGERSLVLDPDGNLHDPADWTREVAEAFAAQAGLELGDVHWTVLDFVRKDGAASGAAPGIRRIVAETGVPQKELYRLFPGGPAVLAARLAGLKKPKSCV